MAHIQRASNATCHKGMSHNGLHFCTKYAVWRRETCATQSGANSVAPFSGLYSRFPSSSQMSHTRGLTLPSSSASSETGCDVNTQQLFSSSLSQECRSSSNTLFEGKVAEEEEKRREKQSKKKEGRQERPSHLYFSPLWSSELRRQADDQPNRTGPRRKTEETGEKLAAVGFGGENAER